MNGIPNWIFYCVFVFWATLCVLLIVVIVAILYYSLGPIGVCL